MTRREKNKKNQRVKICVLTGTRAEYGLLRSLMRAVMAEPHAELQLVVTGTHLVKDFGHSVDLIRRDGFPIAECIPMYSGDDRRADLPKSLAKLTGKLGPWMIEHHSDFIVVLGDRIEALGGALAGLTANIPIAHLHGGELATGDMDDRIRFAVSSLASLHFVASQESKRRLLRSGEPSDRIFVVGAMGLDEIFDARRSFTRSIRSDFRNRYHFSSDLPLFLVVHHPSGYGADVEYQYMGKLLKELSEYQGIIIGPNNDPGHSGIRRAIRDFMAKKKYKNKQSQWYFIENMSRNDYLLALAEADILIGNSSSGIIEANALGTAVVNIGPRQAGRERNGTAIFDCDYDPDSIRKAIQAALYRTQTHAIHPSRRFGNGHAGETIIRVLMETPCTRELLTKQLFQQK
jgi:UDP-hydrolysing UDP-N-acetyl-D-glucosamine 2-epimerase